MSLVIVPQVMEIACGKHAEWNPIHLRKYKRLVTPAWQFIVKGAGRKRLTAGLKIGHTEAKSAVYPLHLLL